MSEVTEFVLPSIEAFTAGAQQTEDAFAALAQGRDILNTGLAENERAHGDVAKQRQQLLQDFFSQLGSAPPIYRAAFEIMIAKEEIPEAWTKYTAERIEGLDSEARRVQQLDDYLVEQPNNTPVLIINSSHAIRLDTDRNDAMQIIDSGVGLAQATAGLKIDHHNEYHPIIGTLNKAVRIKLFLYGVTSVRPNIASARDENEDHERIVSYNAGPIIRTEAAKDFGILPQLTIGHARMRAPEIIFDSTQEIPTDKATIYCGALAVEGLFTRLDSEAQTQSYAYDHKAFEALQTAYEQLTKAA